MRLIRALQGRGCAMVRVVSRALIVSLLRIHNECGEVEWIRRRGEVAVKTDNGTE